MYAGSGRGSLEMKHIVKILVLMIAVFNTGLCIASADASLLNSSGTVNRPLSVDPTGLREGFSAVLYDNVNGLPTSEANAIAETGDGFIWIGSYAGLIRYDGNTFVRMDSTGGITSIKCLYVDSRDRLWIGTNDNGVAVMENGSLRSWGKLDGMTSSHTRDITEDSEGNIYVATNSGITVIDEEYNLTALDDLDIAGADMRILRTGSDGVLYGTTDSGDLMMIKDGELLSFISIQDNPLGGAGAIIPDPENPGMIYQEAADFGLYHVDLNEGFNILEKLDIEPLKYLLSMEFIEDKLWICAGNGVGVLSGGRFQLLDNLPLNNNVGHVMTDYLGNLWFTSSRQGVMKVVPNQFSDISERFNLPEQVVNSTCMHDGKLFVATDTGLIVLDENGPVSELPLKKAVTASGKELGESDLIKLLEEVRIRSIIRDSKDRLWISTWRANGLLCYDAGELTAFTEEDGLLSNNLRTVSEAGDGTILVALTGGLNLIKDGRVTGSFTKEDGIENTESLTVAEGFNGDAVIGSNGGGIYIVNGSDVLSINVEDGLPSDIVMRIRRDDKHNVLWIVASNALAYMTPDHKVTTIRQFPYPNNLDLYEASNGEIWVLSSNGIYVQKADELLANGDQNPVFYGVANGLTCLATANSYSELTAEGDLYIAGSTGICKVNIEKPFEDVNELKAVVPFVEADGEAVYPDASGAFIVPSDTHKLTVNSFVFNYSLSNPKVTYMLKGFDKSSVTVDRDDLLPVDYTNLSGGAYDFVMELKDSMGRGSKEVSVRIIKIKAFYEQIWFFILLGLFALTALTLAVRLYVRRRTLILERKQQAAREQFEETAEALASAIDAKDRYTNGHSRRVAEYSEKIAREAGKSEEECEKVYFAALLHDVGKIGVPLEILSKNGRLTDEEFERIKQHPVVGGQILSSIHNSPWLSVGARYHHERYNGKGYPEGLAGENIPEIARIIAVADAYDAMTSNRSYRNAIPQHIVREEVVKGIGTQFDPEFARIMIHMIDLDVEYRMRESMTGAGLSSENSLRCASLYNECTSGIIIRDSFTRIRLCSQPDDGVLYENSLPTLIVFDSLDGNVHPGEENNKNVLYFEYARIRLDGKVTEYNTRKSEVTVIDGETLLEPAHDNEPELGQRYIVEAVRIKDHMMIRLSDENRTIRIILALPDTTRFTYLAVGGENCFVHNIHVEVSEDKAAENTIPAIAEKISFITGCPEGDVPNIQVDNWCETYTEGILTGSALTLSFHSMSLPTARLVWHCPYISLYSAAGGDRSSEDYREYMLLRVNGEDWSSDEHADNTISIEHLDSFEGWETWKEKNRQGIDCTVKIKRENNRITITTENLGIAIKSVTTIHDDVKDIYAAITGDQCAITDVHVIREDR
ncbi:MAG TPA: histidine kinase [Lachnospiraceae bacterium]|nr:histidine kinase [Lachnospiraceae bacterium]